MDKVENWHRRRGVMEKKIQWKDLDWSMERKNGNCGIKNLKAWQEVVTYKWLESQKEWRERFGDGRYTWIYTAQFSSPNKRHQTIESKNSAKSKQDTCITYQIQFKRTKLPNLKEKITIY